MQTLPNQLKHETHNLTLIERQSDIAMYRTSRDGESTPGWIVAKVQKAKASERTLPNGQKLTFQAKEFLPSAKDFGQTAWFFRSESAARIKFEQRLAVQTAALTVKRDKGQGLGR